MVEKIVVINQGWLVCFAEIQGEGGLIYHIMYLTIQLECFF